LTPGAAANTFNYGSIIGEFSALTEFKNGATDRLFLGLLLGKPTLNVGAFPINTFATRVPPGLTEGTGPSGMIVDNASPNTQASSIYFSISAFRAATPP
jgi:hypothetical protein